MVIRVQKKGKESPHTLIYRFTKAVQESGILVRAKNIKYRDRNISEEKKKRAALRREELKKYYEKLKKLGQI
jgi:ribosomal protein S21